MIGWYECEVADGCLEEDCGRLVHLRNVGDRAVLRVFPLRPVSRRRVGSMSGMVRVVSSRHGHWSLGDRLGRATGVIVGGVPRSLRNGLHGNHWVAPRSLGNGPCRDNWVVAGVAACRNLRNGPGRDNWVVARVAASRGLVNLLGWGSSRVVVRGIPGHLGNWLSRRTRIVVEDITRGLGDGLDGCSWDWDSGHHSGR